MYYSWPIGLEIITFKGMVLWAHLGDDLCPCLESLKADFKAASGQVARTWRVKVLHCFCGSPLLSSNQDQLLGFKTLGSLGYLTAASSSFIATCHAVVELSKLPLWLLQKAEQSPLGGGAWVKEMIQCRSSTLGHRGLGSLGK